MSKETDVMVDRHGSIVGLAPMTSAGREWIEEHCQAEPWQWLAGTLNVDMRYAGEIVAGMQADGLIVR
jgi:hypothetical protein